MFIKYTFKNFLFDSKESNMRNILSRKNIMAKGIYRIYLLKHFPLSKSLLLKTENVAIATV